MTLQSSGAISLADVQTEFGGSNPIGINEYYGVDSGVPASGTISLYNFYGKSNFFTTDIFGYRYFQSYSALSDTYNGNIVTPGSINSPRTFSIRAYSNSGGFLKYYQGGSLNTTWDAVSSYSTVNATFTFGSSSMQFRSQLSDTYYDNTSGYTEVTSNRELFLHQFNLRGGGIS